MTFIGRKEYLITNITKGKIDSSLVLAYYNPSNEPATNWYPVPGSGLAGLYSTRFHKSQDATTTTTQRYSLNILSPDNTGVYLRPVTFNKFKIIIANASSIVKATTEIHLDLSSYYDVKKYYKLPD